MRRAHRFAYLQAIIDRLLQSQPLSWDNLIERFATEIFHHQIVSAALRADPVDRDDVGVVQCRERASLLEKATTPLSLSGHRRQQEFDRDRTLQPFISRSIDLAHPARTEMTLNHVKTEPAVTCQNHLTVP